MIQVDKQGIRLQLNEKVTDSASVQANLEMMDKIDKSFEEGGHISITLINKYLEAVNFKSYINIVEFIKINQLEEHGVNYVASNNKVSIVVDKEKMHNFTKMTNNLSTMFPEKFKTKTETKTINQPEINRKSRIRRRTPEPPSTPIMPGA
jgi:replicative DNA helicase